MTKPKNAGGRPPKTEARVVYSVRLPKRTIEEIRALAKSREQPEWLAIAEAIAYAKTVFKDSLIKRSDPHDVLNAEGKTEKIEILNSSAEAKHEVDHPLPNRGAPILKPGAKSL